MFSRSGITYVGPNDRDQCQIFKFSRIKPSAGVACKQ